MPTYIILPLTHYKTVVYFNSYFAHLYDTTINTLQTVVYFNSYFAHLYDTTINTLQNCGLF